MTSKPHFLGADPQLLKDVDGLKPDKQKHELMLQFEMVNYIKIITIYIKVLIFFLKITGTPISVANRMQFSMQVEPIEEFDLMAKMKPALIPIFWVEETLDLDEKITNLMKYGLYW